MVVKHGLLGNGFPASHVWLRKSPFSLLSFIHTPIYRTFPGLPCLITAGWIRWSWPFCFLVVHSSIFCNVQAICVLFDIVWRSRIDGNDTMNTRVPSGIASSNQTWQQTLESPNYRWYLAFKHQHVRTVNPFKVIRNLSTVMLRPGVQVEPPGLLEGSIFGAFGADHLKSLAAGQHCWGTFVEPQNSWDSSVKKKKKWGVNSVTGIAMYSLYNCC